MGKWLAESIDDISDPYDKARFEAGYAVVKSPKRAPACDCSPYPNHGPNAVPCDCGEAT